MARIRMIKPEFFDDPDVASLSLAARIFFIGLWTQADKEGRLVDDMRRLKVRIFPYDNIDVEGLAVELHGKDMIRRYEDGNGHGFIWVRNFTKHQRPHPKEPASLIPPCDESAVKRNGEPCKETAKPSESGVLILDSGTQKLESPAAAPAAIPARQFQGRGAHEANSLQRDHLTHTICGPEFRFCLSDKAYGHLAAAFNDAPDVTNREITKWVAEMERTTIPEGKSPGDFKWLMAHFNAWLDSIGRVPKPPEKVAASSRLAAIDRWGT